MSIRKRKKIGFKAKQNRKRRRSKLKAAGKDPNKYYVSGIYVGN